MDSITNVQIELSNRCNYSAMHPQCPTDACAEPVTLPLELICGVIDELGAADYSGLVIFSVYNEPLVDPRLFYLLDRLRDKCPSATPYMHTNAWNLDATLLAELAQFGIERVYANAYSDAEAERIAGLPDTVGIRVGRNRPRLDERMDIYDTAPHGQVRACYALGQVVIWHTGEVGLCCIDRKRTVVFGSLHDRSLSDVLVTGKRGAMRGVLAAGYRSCAGVCAGCKREWKTE